MPLMTMDSDGNAFHWAHREPDVIDVEANAFIERRRSSADAAKPYFWLGEEAEWTDVCGVTVKRDWIWRGPTD